MWVIITLRSTESYKARSQVWVMAGNQPRAELLSDLSWRPQHAQRNVTPVSVDRGESFRDQCHCWHVTPVRIPRTRSLTIQVRHAKQDY